MSTFKSSAKVRFCTTLDVRLQSDLLKQGVYHQPRDDRNVMVTDGEIDLQIVHQTGVVDSLLRRISGGTSGLYDTAPYAGMPVLNYMNDRSQDVEAPALEGITVASAAITELWNILFTSKTTFTVRASISGAQGTGSVGSAFTATDLDISIASVSWYQPDTAFARGDRVYIAVYKPYAIIVKITALLACADVLDQFFSETSPNESSQGKRMREQAMELIKQLQDGDARLTDTAGVIAVRMQSVPYAVTTLGGDTSDYDDPTDSLGRKPPVDSFNSEIS